VYSVAAVAKVPRDLKAIDYPCNAGREFLDGVELQFTEAFIGSLDGISI